MQGRFYEDPNAFDSILNKHYSTGQVFTDPDFPAQQESIIDPNDEIDDLADLGPVQWRRVREIPALVDQNGELRIFHGNIEPNDIKQGQIGDCYFLSSLAAIAEKPDRIRAMFLNEDANEFGVYGTTMFKNGIKMQVIIDDLIPCKGNKVAFARSNGPELWVVLLEKMWAKLHGCYDRIAGGLEYETIRDLVGAPGYFFRGIDDDTFEKIFEYDEQNFMMGCSMSDTYDTGLAEQQGIVPGHAYTLLSAAEVLDVNGNTVRLVKLRNPWGSGEWNGDWSDQSPLWTEELRNQVGFINRDDGIFWMDFNDFKEIYGFWSVNKCIDNAKFSNLQLQSSYRTLSQFRDRYKNTEYHLARVKVNRRGMHTFAVSQFGSRLLPRRAGYKYANCIFYMVKENTSNSLMGCTLVDAKITRQDRDTYIEVPDLDKGYYWLYVDMEWQPETFRWLKKDLSFSLNCYGVSDVEFSKDLCNQFEQVEVLDHIMMAYTTFHMENGTGVVKLAKQDFKDIDVFEEENYWKTGYNFKLVQNNTDNQVFIMSHSHLDYKNGIIISPKQANDDMIVSRSQYVFKVEPGFFRGIYSKPYTGYQRGGQANTPKLVDINQMDQLMSYYQQHYERYNLANYNVPSITEDILNDKKMPDDREEVEDEGTAPAVKSGYKPQGDQKRVVKSGMPVKKTIPQQKTGPINKNYEQELEQIPAYMRERVSYLIDQKVEQRVRDFMEEFRQEMYQELADQRRQNEEHIQFYAQQKLGPLPAGKQFVPTQQVVNRPVVKSKMAPQYASQPMGSAQPIAYTTSPGRGAPKMATMPQGQYQPPQYAVKQTAPGYAATGQHFYPTQTNSATKLPQYRKGSGASPAGTKGFRQPPMSAQPAGRGGYMPQTRVSGNFNKQAY